ncbi:hypothetical protein [Blastococcus sp. SYSU DS0539]
MITAAMPPTAAVRDTGAGSPGPLLTRPGPVLVLVLATWTAVPSLVAAPKLTWGLTAALLAVVANAVWWHARALRVSAPVGLLGVVLACGLVASPHYGTLAELSANGARALLLVGCALLAASCGRADAALLARGVVLLAMVQLAVAMASSLLGMPAPWGYQGVPGTTFGTNSLVAALGGRSTGTMAHPIPFGTLMAAAAALCAPRLTGWRLPVRIAAGAASCYGVALSGSRSAALALGVALLVAVLAPGVLRIGAAWRAAAVLALTGALLALRTAELGVVAGLEGTGSLTHRLAALDAAVRLADRPLVQTLVGSGQGSLPDLFAARLLQLDGFFAVDNQLVATFAVAGLIGALALVAAVVTGLLRGPRESRPAALVTVLMFASFDVLEWTATAVLVVVLVCLGTARREGDRRPPPGNSRSAPAQPVAAPPRERTPAA